MQEDYIAELQEKLRQLKQRISQEKELQALANEKEDYNLIRRLQGELAVSISRDFLDLCSQWNFNGLNRLGTMKISSLQG